MDSNRLIPGNGNGTDGVVIHGFDGGGGGGAMLLKVDVCLEETFMNIKCMFVHLGSKKN